MKILMIAPTPFFADRGCHIRILEQIKALRARGHQVKLCTYHIGRDVEGIDIRRTVRIPWYNKLTAGPSVHKLYIDVLLARNSISAARSWRPDVIHAHLHEGIMIAGWLRRFYPVPVLFDAQGSLTDELSAHRWLGNLPPVTRLVSWQERRLNNSGEAVVVSQAATADLFVKRFGVPREKIQVLEDGVDTEAFSARPRDRELRAELGFNDQHKVIAYLGLLTRYQGVDDLLTIVRDVCARDQRARVLIMGYPNESHYKKQAAALGLAAKVVFTGRIDYMRDAPRYLSVADVAVSAKTSSSEGNGKLFNYMSMALPMVAFDTRVNRDILGDTGMMVPVDDTAAMTNAIIGLLSDPQAAKELGARAKKRVEEMHSWSERGERLERIYNGLVGKGN